MEPISLEDNTYYKSADGTIFFITRRRGFSFGDFGCFNGMSIRSGYGWRFHGDGYASPRSDKNPHNIVVVATVQETVDAVIDKLRQKHKDILTYLRGCTNWAPFSDIAKNIPGNRNNRRGTLDALVSMEFRNLVQMTDTSTLDQSHLSTLVAAKSKTYLITELGLKVAIEIEKQKNKVSDKDFRALLLELEGWKNKLAIDIADEFTDTSVKSTVAKTIKISTELQSKIYAYRRTRRFDNHPQKNFDDLQQLVNLCSSFYKPDKKESS